MTDQRAPHPRVLILGEREVVALTACRALGRAGYEVGVASWRRFEEAGVSRYASHYHPVPPIEWAVSQWGDAVRDIVIEGRYDVVLATTDAAFVYLEDLNLPVPTCPQLSGRHLPLIDKARLAELCIRASVAYPRTDAPRTATEDDAALRGMRGPAVVKAARTASIVSDRVVLMPGADVVPDTGAARRAVADIRRNGVDPIVQEYVEGEKLQAVILRRDGATSCSLAFRVLREFPPAGGSEAMLEALSTTHGSGADMVGMLERLADGARYHGLLQAEFILTPDPGRLCVIDVNPRLWGSLRFGELLGFRATERTVRDALGLRSMPPPPDPVGRRYHHLARELRWLRARGRIPRGYLATFSRRDVWDVPSLIDPLPDLLRLKWLLTGTPRPPAFDRR